MGAIFITPVEVTPGAALAWTDVDVSSYIASGATGVILHIRASTDTAYAFGVRKNGSSDARIDSRTWNASHDWCAIGVDASRIFEAYVGSTTALDIWLVGYFDADAVFFTNAPDKSLGTTDAWTDIDISSDTGTDIALAAFFECVSNDGPWNYGFRKNGSSDERYKYTSLHWFATIGVDGSEICEGKTQSTNQNCFLTGYMKAGITANTNATNLSLASTGAYYDLSALPAGAIGGIIEVIGTSNYNYALRKKGSSEDIYLGDQRHCWGLVECDASQLIEGKIENVDVDFFLTGYFAGSIILDLSDSLALADFISNQIGTTKDESLALADSIINFIQTARDETITLNDVIDLLRILPPLDLATETFSLTDTIENLFGRLLDENLTLLDVISLFTQTQVSESISLTDTVSFLAQVSKDENLFIIDMIIKLLVTEKTEGITISDQLSSFAFKPNKPLRQYQTRLLVDMFLTSTSRFSTEDIYITE